MIQEAQEVRTLGRLRKLFFSIIITALAVGMCSSAAFARQASSAELLNRLPPSDLIVSIDAERAVGDALPAVLGGAPALLAEVTKHLDEFTRRTGINPKDFGRVAIGARLQGQALSLLVLARGERIEATKLVAAGLQEAARGRPSREEMPREEFQGHTLYAVEGDLSGGILVTAFDEQTLALGTAGAVRLALDGNRPGGGGANADLIELATADRGALLQFAGRFSEAGAPETGADGTPLGLIVQAVKECNGSFTVESNEARLRLNVKLRRPGQADAIAGQLRSLKQLAEFTAPKGRALMGETPPRDEDASSDASSNERGDKQEGETLKNAGSVGQSVVLPGLGLVVPAPSMNVLKNLAVESAGDMLIIKLDHPLQAATLR